jgi:hypothetical protein
VASCGKSGQRPTEWQRPGAKESQTCNDRQSGVLPDRLHVPWFDCCVPEGTTTVAWAFSLPSSAGCRTSSVADKRQRIIDAFAGLRVQSTAWTNYYNMLTDTTHTEEWLVIPVTSALHKLSANCKKPGSGPFQTDRGGVAHGVIHRSGGQIIEARRRRRRRVGRMAGLKGRRGDGNAAAGGAGVTIATLFPRWLA